MNPLFSIDGGLCKGLSRDATSGQSLTHRATESD